MLHRVLNVLPHQTTVHHRIRRLPVAAGQIAAHNCFQAELFARVECRQHPPRARHAAPGRVVGTWLAEFGEKAEKVNALLAAQVVDQTRRHQRASQRAIPDAVFGKGDFSVRDVADDELLVVFPHEYAGQLLAVLCLQHNSVVTFLDLAIRIEQRLDEVVHRRARPNRRQVRPHLPAGAADGVATDTTEFRPAENLLSARRIALGGGRRGDLLNLGGRKGQLGVFQSAAAGEREDQFGLIATAFARGAEAGFRR